MDEMAGDPRRPSRRRCACALHQPAGAAHDVGRCRGHPDDFKGTVQSFGTHRAPTASACGVAEKPFDGKPSPGRLCQASIAPGADRSRIGLGIRRKQRWIQTAPPQKRRTSLLRCGRLHRLRARLRGVDGRRRRWRGGAPAADIKPAVESGTRYQLVLRRSRLAFSYGGGDCDVRRGGASSRGACSRSRASIERGGVNLSVLASSTVATRNRCRQKAAMEALMAAR